MWGGATLDAQGRTQPYAYTAFGVPLTYAQHPVFGVAGELHDPLSGLVSLRARWYDPDSGTLLTTDPYHGGWQQPHGHHPYQYAYSNPLRFADPSGEIPLLAGVALTAGLDALVWVVGYYFYAHHFYDAAMNDPFWGSPALGDYSPYQIAGSLLGYEQVRQDVGILHDSSFLWHEKAIAYADAVWNMWSSSFMLTSGAKGAFLNARHVFKSSAGQRAALEAATSGGVATVHFVSQAEMAEIAGDAGATGWRVIGSREIYIQENARSIYNTGMHEVQHVLQETTAKPGYQQRVIDSMLHLSAWSTSPHFNTTGTWAEITSGLGSLLPTYLANPLELEAAAAGTNWMIPVMQRLVWNSIARWGVSETYWTVTTYKHEACDLELQTLTTPTRTGR